MLRISRNLFGLAALALVAIAATCGAMYALHEATSAWISESRNFSRIARTAYVAALERELSVARALSDKRAHSDVARNTARLTLAIDSLHSVGRRSPDRASAVDAIKAATNHWVEATRASVSSRKHFEVLRA